MALPIPLGPENIQAWANLFVFHAFNKVNSASLWPISLVVFRGASILEITST